MTTFRQRIQKDINDLIKSVSATKGMILTYPLLVEFFDGDHNAAIFMNQVLYWTDRTTQPNGWFYKTYDDWDQEIKFSYYQVQRVIFGDERVQNPKRNLSDVGLETKVKMAPNGRNATFYRLDVPQFIGMFVEWIEEKFGALTTQVRKLLKPKKDPESQTQPESTFTFSHDDSQSVWFQPKEPEIVPTERVETTWENAYRPEQNQTVTDVWKIAQGQLEIQFDRASFETYLKHIILVDYDPDSLTFTLAAKHAYNVDMLAHRLHRNICRVLSDTFGQDVQIIYISYDDWRDHHR